MTLIDLFKVMDDDEQIRVVQGLEFECTGELDDVMGLLSEEMLDRAVENVWYSHLYNAIVIALE